MGKNNYQNYSNKKKQNTEETDLPVGMPTPEELKTLKKPQPVKQEQVVGVVTNCLAVYVRRTPSKEGDKLTTAKNSEELIVLNDNNPDWYKVKTKDGIIGYSMKDYVRVEK